MILVRIEGVKGNVQIPGFLEYFFAESIGFGVGQKVEALDPKKRDIEVGKQDEQELSIEKSLDSATVYLMHKAMKGRTSGPSNVFGIDVVLIQTISEDEATAGKPYLKIRIENALIKNWDLNASADGRPTESLKIWFNKASMTYIENTNGRIFQEHGPKGWDQQANKEWP